MGKRRRRLLVVAGATAALGLASCGAQATIDQAVSSLGASPYLQVHLTGSASGPSVAQTAKVVDALSVDVRCSSASGTALSASAGRVDTELLVDVHGAPLADVRQVSSNVYVRVDLQALAGLPGVDISSQDLAAAELLVGNRWFELPQSLLQQLATQAPPQLPAGEAAAARSAARQVVDDVAAVVEATPYSTLPGGGLEQTGSLQQIVQAALPGLDKLTGRQLKPAAVHGTYTASFTMSGSTASGGSIDISSQSSAGTDHFRLTATVAHARITVAAPAGATVITPSLLQQLAQLGQQLGAGAITSG